MRLQIGPGDAVGWVGEGVDQSFGKQWDGGGFSSGSGMDTSVCFVNPKLVNI